jgi:pectin methylesterase-like acyl-CoA thioesterase
MKILVKHTDFGFQYQTEGSKGFKYFADGVNTIEQVKQYFMNGRHASGGQYNEPEIVFCNQEGKPAKLYTIKTGEKYAGSMFATVDYSKRFLLDSNDFVPDSEKLEFFLNHSSMKQDQEASKIESDSDKVKFYLNNVTEETKFLYKNFLNEKMTPDVLKELCENNAKSYGLPASIEIVE